MHLNGHNNCTVFEKRRIHCTKSWSKIQMGIDEEEEERRGKWLMLHMDVA
jgi:hypothetical protein